MEIKAIDSEGLKSRTRRYEQSNVYEMFSDIRKIRFLLMRVIMNLYNFCWDI